MKKRIDWFNIMMWIIVFIGIAGGILIIHYSTPSSNHEKICSDECKKFDMKYYKIELPTPIECWCLNEGKPYSIGKVYEK